MARLIPDGEKLCLGRDLAEVLAQAELSAEEASAWYRDLRTAGKTLKSPSDKWT